MTPVTHTMAMRRQIGIVFEKRPWWRTPGRPVRNRIKKSGTWTVRLPEAYVVRKTHTGWKRGLTDPYPMETIAFAGVIDNQTGRIVPRTIGAETIVEPQLEFTVFIKNARPHNFYGKSEAEVEPKPLCEAVFDNMEQELESGGYSTKPHTYALDVFYSGWPAHFRMTPYGQGGNGLLRRHCTTIEQFLDDITVSVADMRNVGTLGETVPGYDPARPYLPTGIKPLRPAIYDQSLVSDRTDAIGRRFMKFRTKDMTPVTHTLRQVHKIGATLHSRAFWQGRGDPVEKGIYKSGQWTFRVPKAFIISKQKVTSNPLKAEWYSFRSVTIAGMIDGGSGEIVPQSIGRETIDQPHIEFSIRPSNYNVPPGKPGDRVPKSYETLCQTVLEMHDKTVGTPTRQGAHHFVGMHYHGWNVLFHIQTANSKEGGQLIERHCGKILDFFESMMVSATDVRRIGTTDMRERQFRTGGFFGQTGG
ncbi:MAG: hypothetical protein AAGE89_05025 [Pseudomonadota bacterium]